MAVLNLTCPRCGYPVTDEQATVRCPRCNHPLQLPPGCPGECGKCIKKRKSNLTTEGKGMKKTKVWKKQPKLFHL